MQGTGTAITATPTRNSSTHNTPGPIGPGVLSLRCTEAMDNDPAATNVVLNELDCVNTTWDDHRGRLTFRTVFSADSTATRHFVTGVADLDEGGYLALHRHEQAETYHVLSGSGVVSLDGVEHLVGAGSHVFIPSFAEHGIRNTGTQTLRFFYALAANSFADVDYVFS